MAIENEVVRFVAEIELDPQDKATFTKALQDANDSCDALRSAYIQHFLAHIESAHISSAPLYYLII